MGVLTLGGLQTVNRLTRDEVLHRALDMIDAKQLDARDRPQGSILPDALSLSWLQDGLDLFHHEFPWQGTLRTATLTLQGGPLALPTDFMLDVRDGIVLKGLRLRRTPVQRFINATLQNTAPGDPQRYTWYGDAFYVWPVPATGTPATLWYYALPAVLAPSQKPLFPSDWCLVEYVRLRGMEWLRLLPPSTARNYGQEEIGRLRQAGLMGEPENDELPLDSERFLPTAMDRTAWMGRTTVG